MEVHIIKGHDIESKALNFIRILVGEILQANEPVVYHVGDALFLATDITLRLLLNI